MMQLRKRIIKKGRLQGMSVLDAALRKGGSAVIYVGNGAAKHDFVRQFRQYGIQGADLTDYSGTYRCSAIQYVTAQDTKVPVLAGFWHELDVRFVGYHMRRRTQTGWQWYCENGEWQDLTADTMHKKLIMVGDNLALKASEQQTVFLDAQWENEAGVRVNCGYPVFSHSLMAHSFGGMNDKTYHNTLEALHHGIAKGYRYFEADLSYTSDKRLVLCHGWTEANCKYTGFTYDPSFADMTYKRIMGMRVHGNPIMSARSFYKQLKRHPDCYFEIDFHHQTGGAIRERVRAMIADFRFNPKILDRLLIQAYSRNMYENIDRIYHFQYYQYLVGKNCHKMDEILTYCLDHGICAVAMRCNLAKPEMVRKAKNAGMYVLAYTVNRDLEYARNLLQSGVDTLCTDFITHQELEKSDRAFGQYPYYVYYNSREADAVSAYTLQDHMEIKTVSSGALELHDRNLWRNDGTQRLLPNSFVRTGYTFAGWNLRVHIDGKYYWYCQDGCYHGKGDFDETTGVVPYLYADQAQLPVLKLKNHMRLIMVAVWKKEGTENETTKED